MKKILVPLCLLAAVQVQAQSTPFYVQANGGGQFVQQQFRQFTPSRDGNGFGYNAGLSVGLTRNRWQISAGLSCLSNTNMSESTTSVFEHNLDPVTGVTLQEGEQVKFYGKYVHVLLPVRAGYQVIRTDKFKLLPVLGMSISYNASYKEKIASANEHYGYRETGYLGKEMARVSLWGSAGAELQFTVSRKATLVVNPEATYMLTSFNTKGPNRQHTLMAGINAGIRWYLGK